MEGNEIAPKEYIHRLVGWLSKVKLKINKVWLFISCLNPPAPTEDHELAHIRQVLKVLRQLKTAASDVYYIAEAVHKRKALRDLNSLFPLIDPYPSTLKSFNDSAFKAHSNNYISFSPHCNFSLPKFGSYDNLDDTYRAAGPIESEIQNMINRGSINVLSPVFQSSKNMSPLDRELEERVIDLLNDFTSIVSKGFNKHMQDLLLQSNVFIELEALLCCSGFSNKFQEAFAIAKLIEVYKECFIGQISLCQTVEVLISMATGKSLQVFHSLIRDIGRPLVDKIVSNGRIPKILSFLSSEQPWISMRALYCILEIAHFGREAAVDLMLEEGLVEKMVQLQNMTSELEIMQFFGDCVSSFVMHLKTDEGLGHTEKITLTLKMLKRLRDQAAYVPKDESATIVS